MVCGRIAGDGRGSPGGARAVWARQRARSITADAADPAQVEQLFEQALAFFSGRLDVLFHVAGISGRRFGDAALHECTVEGWDTVLDANARSLFLTNRAAVRQMLTQPLDDHGLRGTVLNMGSVLGWSPAPDFFGTFAYAASKGAIRAMTLNAAARYARDRIRFNLIAPGLIETPMAGRAVGDPAIRAYLATKQPMAGGPGNRRGLRRGGPLPLRAGLAVPHRRGPERRWRLVRLRGPAPVAQPPCPPDSSLIHHERRAIRPMS